MMVEGGGFRTEYDETRAEEGTEASLLRAEGADGLTVAYGSPDYRERTPGSITEYLS